MKKRQKFKRKPMVEREAIIYKKNKEGLYPGMPGTVTYMGRTFLLPTEEEYRNHRLANSKAAFICFGRISSSLKKKPIHPKLMKKRLKYLTTYKNTINRKNQILTTKEERNALLPG